MAPGRLCRGPPRLATESSPPERQLQRSPATSRARRRAGRLRPSALALAAPRDGRGAHLRDVAGDRPRRGNSPRRRLHPARRVASCSTTGTARARAPLARRLDRPRAEPGLRSRGPAAVRPHLRLRRRPSRSQRRPEPRTSAGALSQRITRARAPKVRGAATPGRKEPSGAARHHTPLPGPRGAGDETAQGAMRSPFSAHGAAAGLSSPPPDGLSRHRRCQGGHRPARPRTRWRRRRSRPTAASATPCSVHHVVAPPP